VLVALAKFAGEPVTKSDLTAYVRTYYPETNDVQQARHLGRQQGWYIASGRRGDIGIELEADEYCLVSLEDCYPEWAGTNGHRSARPAGSFDDLKAQYGNRCATCGSEEGKKNFINRSVLTRIQQGHMDPRRPLTLDNCIPQCQECNQAYTDKFIFDGHGRVVDINPASFTWRGRIS